MLKTIEPELEFFDEKWASHPVSQPSPKPSKQQLTASSSDYALGYGSMNDNYTDLTLQSSRLGILHIYMFRMICSQMNTLEKIFTSVSLFVYVIKSDCCI